MTTILQKAESERTPEDETVLKNNEEVVKKIQKNKQRKLKTEERNQEVKVTKLTVSGYWPVPECSL